MKRWVVPLLVIFVLAFATTVSAKAHDDDKHRHGKKPHPSYYKQKHWQRVSHHPAPFRWHEHRDYFHHRGHRLERLYDDRWHEEFPGLRAYKWHDDHEGFWYHGHHKSDAIMFYDDGDNLVSIGFMHNGAFILIRDDDSSYESRDTFYLSWHR